MAIRSFHDLNKKQQLGVLIGVPVLVAILLGVFIYRSLGVLGPDPSLPSFLHRNLPSNKWAQIQDLEKKIADKQVIIDRGPAARQRLADLEADIREGRDRLPLESEKAEMRLLIEKLARDIPSDIGVVKVKAVKIIENAGSKVARAAQSQSARAGAGKPEEVIYQTVIEGDTNGIIKYIDMIEKNARFMLVNSFTLKPGKVGTDDEGKVTFAPHEVSMNIITYVYNPGGKEGAR